MDDIQKLRDIMARLRDPVHGCPWDVAQDFSSIAPYTIEEAYEVADAIERQDLQDLREELGDLLLQVVFHARMAEEQGAFAFPDVVSAICAKLIRRHPHVFGDERVSSAAEQSAAWEKLKAAEHTARGPASASILATLPAGLPALSRAAKLGKRASSVGFDWSEVRGVRDKLKEELAEVDAALAGEDPAEIAEEIGDLLFATANLARHAQLDPEAALRHANSKFERRFGALEHEVRASGRTWADYNAGELDQLWRQIKSNEIKSRENC
jgi:MazG family protein